MTESAETVIRVEGVHKWFGQNHALRGADLEVIKGESLVLVGPSAAGKSLLLKCILGLVSPDSGSIRVDGAETVQLGEEERLKLIDRFGVLFQRSALFDSMPVWRNVAFRLLQDKSIGQAQARDVAIAKITSVGLRPEDGDLLPGELSGGMQKRVALARAIATDPEILFLDEPTAGLDPIMSNVINDLILENVNDLGATTVSINSDITGAKKISTRVAMMHKGRVLWTGPTADVEDSGNPYVDQFIHHRGEGPIQMAIRQA